ncbi:NADPH-dependent 2,4-dienoyl-CoA reductase/sulfur reductase-like enzyme [Haloactinopolyspora alba]|uniref:NADPH-dependent 2,4-dienoyl-CoA reductase/sulfur reductase-like enzyme n=1 Tax=Haloactinopolyspora alba TaxID=648780 RepID=A0A2P8DYU1_9ACTN|nr:FAD-dependent oxidoreductase [Haloactinopolyspora alba]PSL02388.1 NADPH-dependent 2,4-dienoyl-CoA reductase/sulfur reductase-like enzyme [Haloactinopolyspora alba]
MAERVVVVGGDAAGMSAASQAIRVAGSSGRELEVVALDRGHWTSYSACGIPYWVAGDVDGPEGLVARAPDEHRRNGIDVRMLTEAVAVDLDGRWVEVVDHDGGGRERLGFDQLVLATGAAPVAPDVPGADAAGVFGVQTLDDGDAVIRRLGTRPRRAVVVGAGYIGVEMAEALTRRGLAVTVVDQAPEPMTTLDPDLGRLVHDAMEGMGIGVVTGARVERFETRGDGGVRAVVTDAGTFDADIVVLGTGVRPATSLAREAGLPLGKSGGVRVDDGLRVPGHDGVWSAGDCVESYDRVSGTWVHVPLGTHANKQGRVLGTNLGGGDDRFPGVVRTAISKVCDLEIARTGLGEADAAAAGFDAVAVTTESTTTAGYFPGAAPMTVKMLAERSTGRLLGAQIVGRAGSAKRIDVCALALWNEMAVGDLAMTDLSYAPPFSPVWDPVQIAARRVADRV